MGLKDFQVKNGIYKTGRQIGSNKRLGQLSLDVGITET